MDVNGLQGPIRAIIAAADTISRYASDKTPERWLRRGASALTALTALRQSMKRNPAQEPAVVDHGALRSLLALGGADFVCETLGQFLSESEAALRSMHEALAAQDAEVFASRIHALRSSSANVGAVGLYGLCLQEGVAGRDSLGENRMAQGPQRLASLERQFALTATVLRTHIEHLRQPAPQPLRPARADP